MESYEEYKKFATLYTNIHAIPLGHSKVEENKIKSKSNNILTSNDGNRLRDISLGSKLGSSNLSFVRSNSDNENIILNTTPKSKKEELKKWISRL